MVSSQLSEEADQNEDEDSGVARKISAGDLLLQKSSIEIKKVLTNKITDQINLNLLRGLNDSKIVEDTLKLFKD